VVCVLRRGGLDHKVEELGIPLMEAPFTIEPRPGTNLLQRARLASRPFKAANIDIWHSWHYLDDYTEPLIAKFAGAKKWIYTKKNMSWGSNGWRLRSLLANAIVTISPQMETRFFNSPFYRKKVCYIPVGIDIELFKFYKNNKIDLRRKLGLADDITIVGCVANLMPVKDHATLIKALAITKTEAHLVLIGQGEDAYRERLISMTIELGILDRIHFWGPVRNVNLHPLLSEMDIFVLSSKHEGLGAALLEAMACERACIATRCGGPEAVIEDGLDGFLVDVGDYQGLAQRIDMLVNDPGLRQEIGSQARQKIISSFSHFAQSAGYDRLYRHLVGLPPS